MLVDAKGKIDEGYRLGKRNVDLFTFLEMQSTSEVRVGYVMGWLDGWLAREPKMAEEPLECVGNTMMRAIHCGANWRAVAHLLKHRYAGVLDERQILELCNEAFARLRQINESDAPAAVVSLGDDPQTIDPRIDAEHKELELAADHANVQPQAVTKEERISRSEKPKVVEAIYNNLIAKGDLRTVTSSDVIAAIVQCKAVDKEMKLSTKNPANFLKDIIRGTGASAMWPASLKEKRITAKQVTGKGNVLEFIPYEPDATEPFPNRFGYVPTVTKEHTVQSVSIPLASKELGRDDETYLIQVAVKLGIVETHFALFSPLKVIELNHLQMGIKLRLCELDSVFSATYVTGNKHTRLIITAEAKKKNQRILEDQIINQVKSAFTLVASTDVVVPIAMTSVDGGIYIAEFEPVYRKDHAKFSRLELAVDVFYKLEPQVQGI